MGKRLLLVLCVTTFIMVVCKAMESEYYNPTGQYPDYGLVIDFRVKKIEPVIINGPVRKSPPRIPTVYLSADTLYFTEGASFDEIQLVAKDGEDEEVVYSSVVPYGEELFCLPDYFVGVYELRLLRGDYCFYADIEL
ncbi:MAG: hypothetical protein J6B91_01450 [Prevotella sp.]|nr:hypothetical protein [Prevotella sp.]